MHVVPSIGGIVASNLKPAHSAELYATLRTEKIRYEKRTKSRDGTVTTKERYGRPLGPTTVLRIHRFMHRMLGWAERKEIVVRNVARKEMEIAPKAVPSPARALTADQVAAFLAAAEGSEHCAFFILAVATGMRRGEIGALTWDAIDAERGAAVVRQAIGEDRKGIASSRRRRVAGNASFRFNRLALAALRRHGAVQREERMLNRDRYADQGLVFADELGGLVDLDAVSKAFAAIACAAGIKTKGISLHSCRHFCATQALVAGNDHVTVGALLGHSLASTTLNVYGHVVAGAKERAVACIEDAIAAAQARRAAGQN
jgi:integrase